MSDHNDRPDLVLRLPSLPENATIASIASYITSCILGWSTAGHHRNLLETRIQQALQLVPDAQTRQDILGFIVQSLDLESSLLATASSTSEPMGISITSLATLPTLKDILALYSLSESQLQSVEGMSTSEYRLYLAEERVAVEIIKTSLLRTRGFKYFDQWEDYLLKLDEQQIIDLIDCRLLDANNSVTLYSIPVGYRQINRVIQERDCSSSSKLNESLLVLHSLNNKVHIAKATADSIIGAASDFEIFSVFPDLVIWSGSDVRVIGIGASLVNARRYISAQQISTNSTNLKANKTEIRSRAYPRFLGLMFFELITGKSPTVVEEELLSERASRPYLSESPLISNLGYPAHIRAFLKRATHSIDTFRYSKFETISEDIRYISEFVNFLTHFEKDDAIEFVDFLGLRLKAHNRNPKLLRMTSFERAQSLLAEISDDFATFVGDDKTWMHRIRQATVTETFRLSPELFQWLHYNSLHLLDVYNLWCSLLMKWKTTALSSERANGLDIISITILAEVVRLEALAYMQVLGRRLKEQYRETNIPQTFVLDFEVTQSEEYAISLVSEPFVKTKFDFTATLIDQVKHILGQLFAVDDYRRFSVIDVALRGQSASIIDVAFFALVTSRCLVVFKHGQIIWSNAPVSHIDRQAAQLHLRTAEDIKHFALKLIRVFPNYENDAPPNAACFVPPSTTWSNISGEALNILDSLHQSAESKRERVYITRYRQSYPFLSGDIQYRERTEETKHTDQFTERDLLNIPFALGVPGHLRAKIDIFGQNHSLATVVPFIKLFPISVDTPKERVFVAHHYVDTSIVTEIINRCHREKYEVIDFRHTPINKDWWTLLLREVQESDLILAVCSMHALNDESFTSVCKLASDLQKSLHILVMDENVERQSVFNIFRSESHSITLYETMGDTALNSFFQKIIDADVWTYRPLDDLKIALPVQPTYLPLAIADKWLESNQPLPAEGQELILASLKWHLRHYNTLHSVIQELARRLREHKDVIYRIKEETEFIIKPQKGLFARWNALDTNSKIAIISIIIGAIATIVAALFDITIVNIDPNTLQPSEIYNSTLAPGTLTEEEIFATDSAQTPQAILIPDSIPTEEISTADSEQTTQVIPAPESTPIELEVP